MLGQNNPIAGFVHILPNAGLYLTQHCLECISSSSSCCSICYYYYYYQYVLVVELPIQSMIVISV